MDDMDRQLREWHRKEPALTVKEENMARTVRASREALYRRAEETVLSFPAFLFKQGRYIQKRWWILQAAVLILLWNMLYSVQDNALMIRCAGTLLPVFVILLIPELWKNLHSHSLEIEDTAYFSMRKIYAARLMLFGLADMCMLSLFSAMVSLTVQLTLWEMLQFFVIPFNVTCAIVFGILYKGRNGTEYLTVALCLLWTAAWECIVLDNALYTKVAGPVWIGLVILSFVGIGFEIAGILKDNGKKREDGLLWS